MADTSIYALLVFGTFDKSVFYAEVEAESESIDNRKNNKYFYNIRSRGIVVSAKPIKKP